MRALALIALLVAAGCDDGEPPPSPALLSDIDRLRQLMATDPTLQPMEEVERVADARPVEAARRLRTGALPAARSQLERTEGVLITSDEGRRLRGQLSSAYRARIEALEDYESILVDAATDVEGLMRALRAQSDAEREVLAVHDALDGIQPLAPAPEASPADPDEDEPARPGLGAPGPGGASR